MSLGIVLLDSNENFLEFIDNDLIEINETHEKKSIRTCNVSYKIEDLNHTKEIFKMGNKLWVSKGNTIDDCLYVISENINFNLYQDNVITFPVEEVLVELNNAPFFSQTDLTQNNVDRTSQDGKVYVNVNRKALEFWFGNYFNIGLVQSCLTPHLQKIAPTGTMTLMKLLRYIEDETSNIFVTRYEKDPEKNLIHRYLDFLNPDQSNLSWNLKAEFEFYEEADPNLINLENENIVSENILEEDDIVTFPNFTIPTPLNFDNLKCNFKSADGTLLTSFDLSEEGLMGNAEIYTFLINYSNGEITINIEGKNVASVSQETLSQQINPSDYSYVQIESTTKTKIKTLPNGSIFEIIDSQTEKIIYNQTINASLGNVQPQILDLGYNTEDIDFEINESDTFNAIAPILTLSDSTDSNALTRSDYDTIIKKWIKLTVSKGDLVPMIIQKTNSSTKPSARSASVVSGPYWSRPLKPNDQTDGDDKSYEYLEGTAYWAAPFSKHKGEIFVADDTETGVDYNAILGKKDVKNTNVVSTPKIGPVETNDEDVYAIFNAVCLKLKDKRYPSVNVKASVANFRNGFNNNYRIYDKVFLKIPGISKLVSAEIVKTVKNPKNPIENAVELDSYSISNKNVQKDTEIIANNIQLKYPNKKNLEATLLDDEGYTLKNKLVTFAVSKVDDSGTSFVKSYTKKTNSNGIAKLQIGLKPGNYTIDITYGGDVVYSSSANSVSVNVSGKVKSPQKSESSASKKKTTTKKVKVTTYYDKYGVSPDKKYVHAVGRSSAGIELSKYGYTFYEAEYYNYCPRCGRKGKLFWDIFYAGNERGNWGRVRKTGNLEEGSAEGHIFCSACDADFSIFGRDHGANVRLKVHEKPKESSKSRAYKLKNGKMPYKVITKTVKTKKVTSTKQRQMVSRSSYPNSQSGKISSSVKSKALSIVENSTGIPAAKKIIKWVAKHIKWEDRYNFYQSPATTLRRRTGNCCCQADLAAQMLDAAGVCTTVDVRYVHVHRPNTGHVFLRINKTYADPCKVASPWGHYVTGYGKPGSGPITKYPKLPFARGY